MAVRDGHAIAEEVRHHLLHDVAHLDDVNVHVDPDDPKLTEMSETTTTTDPRRSHVSLPCNTRMRGETVGGWWRDSVAAIRYQSDKPTLRSLDSAEPG